MGWGGSEKLAQTLYPVQLEKTHEPKPATPTHPPPPRTRAPGPGGAGSKSSRVGQAGALMGEGAGLRAQAQLWESRLCSDKAAGKLSPPSLVWGKDGDCSIPKPNTQRASRRTRPRDAESLVLLNGRQKVLGPVGGCDAEVEKDGRGREGSCNEHVQPLFNPVRFWHPRGFQV